MFVCLNFVTYLSNRPHVLWVYRRYNPRGRDVGRTREKRVKSFACVHPTSQVGYLAGQLIENVVYCFLKNNLTFSMSLQGQ